MENGNAKTVFLIKNKFSVFSIVERHIYVECSDNIAIFYSAETTHLHDIKLNYPSMQTVVSEMGSVCGVEKRSFKVFKD